MMRSLYSFAIFFLILCSLVCAQPIGEIIVGESRSKSLPEVKVPEYFFNCRTDGDCAVAGDACRSCGDLIIINRKYLRKFKAMDKTQREKSGFNPNCEACSTNNVILSCKEGKCAQGATAP